MNTTTQSIILAFVAASLIYSVGATFNMWRSASDRLRDWIWRKDHIDDQR